MCFQNYKRLKLQQIQKVVEDIKVSDLHEDIQATESEVIHKILIELEKKNRDVETVHLVAHETFFTIIVCWV